MSKLKKIDKEFLLTDSSVNSYGFRLMTSGYLMAEYQKNPIGYDMHKRDTGVLVRWEDLRVDGEKVYGKPVINLNHVNGQKTVEDIENGFLNAASVGHLVILEMTDDPSMKLAGQVGPTATKWFNRECSLVDVPGNFNALKLYDKDEKEINLADFTITKLPNEMKKFELTGAQLAALNLKAESTDTDFATVMNDLVAKAAKVDSLTLANTNLNAEVASLKEAGSKKEVKGILEAALAAKKITQELSNTLEKDYATNPTGLKAVVDALPEYQGVVKHIEKTVPMNEKRVQDLVAKGFDALMETGEIVELKAKAPEAYKQLYKDTFGSEPKEAK